MHHTALARFFHACGARAHRYLALLATICLVACSAPSADNQVTDLQGSLTTAVYRINCGGGAVGSFSADQFVSGGNTWSSGTVSTTGVANAAPAAVYQSERYGNHSYNFGGLEPGASFVVRLHFAETKFNAAGARVFNVLINGVNVLPNFDIFASVGFSKALVLDFDTTASSAGQVTVQYVTVVDNAKSSGIEIFSGSSGSSGSGGSGSGQGNQSPTIANAPSANANPVLGTSSTLSVLGADDGGEASLVYTWSTSGTPPAAVSFSANASNSAKNTVVTFSKAGSYALTVTVKDAAGLSTSSALNLQVNQKLTSVNVTPSNASVQLNGTQQFAATGKDQFGAAMSPTFAWAVSGGGTIDTNGLFSATSTGAFTVTATSGSANGSAAVTVSSAAAPAGSAVYQINCGGGAVAPFTADQFASGGSTWNDATAVSTSGVANAAPAAVYQTERYGSHAYNFASLTPGATYVVRLHFAETKFTTAGSRTFNVLINGTQVLTNFDIFAAAGLNKALVRDFTSVASSAGKITIQYVTVVDNARSSGIEILSGAGGGSSPPPNPGNKAPTVATPAAANPNPTSGKTTSLSVVGADDGGQASLTYTWAATGPAAVSFSSNASNSAKNTTANFTKAGSYTLTATITDASGSSVASSTNVVVNQTTTSISVTPRSAQVAAGGSQQFLASVKDQFGNAMSPQPSVAWTVSGGGTINSIGLFSAGSSSGGPFNVNASAASLIGSASVTVAASGGTAQYSTDFNLTESPISEGGAWQQMGVDWTRVITANGLAFGTQPGNGGFNDSYAYLAGDFAANQSASAVIHLESGLSGGYYEVEILLRWRDSAHFSTGYECNLAYNGQYAEIIIWPGAYGTDKSQFKWVSSGNPVAGGVHDGDVFQADIVGNVITSRLNGKVIATGVDSSIPSGGAPGIGFYAEGMAASQKFSFSKFSGGSL